MPHHSNTTPLLYFCAPLTRPRLFLLVSRALLDGADRRIFVEAFGCRGREGDRSAVTMKLNVDGEYGWVVAAALLLYLQQQVIFVVIVVRARMRTHIKAPTLYPRDSEIKDLKLSPDQVDGYMRAQRIHQNNRTSRVRRRRRIAPPLTTTCVVQSSSWPCSFPCSCCLACTTQCTRPSR